MSLPASYRETQTCSNCKHRDEGPSPYYCTLRSPPPEQGGVTTSSLEYVAAQTAWYQWLREQTVKPHGTCDEWEKR